MILSEETQLISPDKRSIFPHGPRHFRSRHKSDFELNRVYSSFSRIVFFFDYVYRSRTLFALSAEISLIFRLSIFGSFSSTCRSWDNTDMSNIFVMCISCILRKYVPWNCVSFFLTLTLCCSINSLCSFFCQNYRILIVTLDSYGIIFAKCKCKSRFLGIHFTPLNVFLYWTENYFLYVYCTPMRSKNSPNFVQTGLETFPC